MGLMTSTLSSSHIGESNLGLNAGNMRTSQNSQPAAIAIMSLYNAIAIPLSVVSGLWIPCILLCCIPWIQKQYGSVRETYTKMHD